MDQILATWQALSVRRRFVVVAATLAMFLCVLGLAQLATQPQKALLYAGLEARAAGEVVAALEARGAHVEVRGSSIYVDAAERDSLRLSLASDGLPQTGGHGYELLDNLTGFGTTAQMFDAAYWRAKEGELARTISGNRQFSSVRVHISNPANDAFGQGRVEAASVSVTMASGSLSAGHATAIRFLVASAVAGLAPEDVAVIDSVQGLIPNSEAPISLAQNATNAREEALKASVTRLLEARVGTNKAIVEVSVDTITEREEITERKFEPDSRVPISSDSEETSTSTSDRGNRNVTVASNLPAGESDPSTNSTQSNETRTRETINYEVSETQRAVVREPGAIKRISVAALVDGVITTDADGVENWQARSDAELADLRDLVASAIGFDEERGDLVTIRSMEFQPEPVFQPGPAPTLIDRLSIDPMGALQLAVLAFVSLVLGLFVLRPLLLAAPKSLETISLPAELSEQNSPLLEQATAAAPPILEDDFTPLGELPDFDSIQTSADPTTRLRQLIDQKQDETVEVLSQWMGGSASPGR